MLLVFLTRDYISSKNCRRELVAAMHEDLPIVVLRESEYSKGAVTSGRLQAKTKMRPPSPSTRSAPLSKRAPLGRTRTRAPLSRGRQLEFEQRRQC